MVLLFARALSRFGRCCILLFTGVSACTAWFGIAVSVICFPLGRSMCSAYSAFPHAYGDGHLHYSEVCDVASFTKRGDSTHYFHLVDPASSHMLVSKIKPCMSEFKLIFGETANGSLYQL